MTVPSPSFSSRARLRRSSIPSNIRLRMFSRPVFHSDSTLLRSTSNAVWMVCRVCLSWNSIEDSSALRSSEIGYRRRLNADDVSGRVESWMDTLCRSEIASA